MRLAAGPTFVVFRAVESLPRSDPRVLNCFEISGKLNGVCKLIGVCFSWGDRRRAGAGHCRAMGATLVLIASNGTLPPFQVTSI